MIISGKEEKSIIINFDRRTEEYHEIFYKTLGIKGPFGLFAFLIEPTYIMGIKRAFRGSYKIFESYYLNDEFPRGSVLLRFFFIAPFALIPSLLVYVYLRYTKTANVVLNFKLYSLSMNPTEFTALVFALFRLAYFTVSIAANMFVTIPIIAYEYSTSEPIAESILGRLNMRRISAISRLLILGIAALIHVVVHEYAAFFLIVGHFALRFPIVIGLSIITGKLDSLIRLNSRLATKLGTEHVKVLTSVASINPMKVSSYLRGTNALATIIFGRGLIEEYGNSAIFLSMFAAYVLYTIYVRFATDSLIAKCAREFIEGLIYSKVPDRIKVMVSNKAYEGLGVATKIILILLSSLVNLIIKG